MNYEFTPLEIVSMVSFGIMYILNTKQQNKINFYNFILGGIADKKAKLLRDHNGSIRIQPLDNEH
jgi:hypothetical protein